jgi:hypothetical protein
MRAFDKVQPETFIVFSPGKPPTAGKAGGSSANPAHPRKMTLAALATIQEPAA